MRGQEAGSPKKWTGGSNPLELNLWQDYTQVMKNVRKHLQNNIDTNSAINELLGLVGKVNTYLSQVKDAAQGYLLLTISQYIMRILKCFGLTDDSFDQKNHLYQHLQISVQHTHFYHKCWHIGHSVS